MKRHHLTDELNVWALARDFLHAYMPKMRGLSPNTIQAYRISLESFLGYLTQQQHIDRSEIRFEHFDRQQLKAWLAWMHTERGYAAQTVKLRLSAVTAFLSYAAAEDISLMSVHQAARTLKAPRPPRLPIEYLDEDATRTILAAHTGETLKSPPPCGQNRAAPHRR